MILNDIIGTIFFSLSDTNEKQISNPVISPYSIFNAIVLIRKSVCGKTALEIDEIMGNDFVSMMEKNLIYVNSKVSTTNAVFSSFPSKCSYAESIQKINGNYQYIENLNTEASRMLINKFISQQTRGLVNNFLSTNLSNAVSFLANVTYLKDTWYDEFEKKDSVKDIFTNINGEKKTIMFMRGKRKYCQYKKTLSFEICKLPLAKNSFMVFIIPNTNIDVPIDRIIAECHTFKNDNYVVNVKIPVMNIEYETENLPSLLRQIGIEKLFTGSKCDWEPSLGDKLTSDYQISKISHKVVVKLDEKGVEATAVTSGIICTNGPSSSPEIKIFNCNKPFFYSITDEVTSQILFFGMKTTF